MKSNQVVFGVVFVMLLSWMSACKRHCHDCHYDGPNGEVELGEKCGEEVEALEAEGYSSDSVNYKVHCHEH